MDTQKKSEVYFISDCHFNHTNIHLKFRKEFSSVEEHNLTILEGILSLGRKRHVLWMLGDNFMDKDSLMYLWQISPHWLQINVVLGNHDFKEIINSNLPFNVNIYGMQKKYGCWLTHAPVHPNELRDCPNIHGHVHTHTLPDKRYFNVSCENVGYKPISLTSIREYFDVSN